MALRASTARPTPIQFGRETPYDFTTLDELFEAVYAPLHRRTVHVACGNGRVSIYLAQCGMQVLGIDPDRELLSSARERAIMAGVELDFMAGDPLLLPPLPEESFGLVVDFTLAASLADGLPREEHLRRLHRILMRKGVLLTSAPQPYRRNGKPTDRAFAFAGPFVSDITRAGFEVLFEGLRTTPPGEQRLVVHARKPG
ncbi:MAG: class I SAM-dependent methyltransferase [Planctomycetes bacterium]|jgi:SAM-dependent methyltransferase|nr:class I SAM-dependent methyltransferase [Planctomycetota bacterium]